MPDMWSAAKARAEEWIVDLWPGHWSWRACVYSTVIFVGVVLGFALLSVWLIYSSVELWARRPMGGPLSYKQQTGVRFPACLLTALFRSRNVLWLSMNPGNPRNTHGGYSVEG